MTIKRLLANEREPSIAQWKQQREDIKARLFETIGVPPMERNTRAIEIINEEKLDGYLRRKISYQVGEGEKITAYLLQPRASRA